MMSFLSFILLVLGLILILIEFFVPGAIIGILGGILVLASIVNFATTTSSVLAIIFFFIGAVISVYLIIRFAIWRIVKAKPNHSIFLSQDQEGYFASSFDASAIGKEGIVVSDLKPGGYILVDGKQHQALSTSGYISKGSRVQVISGQEESLLVIKKQD